jgi:hypothetical protein
VNVLAALAVVAMFNQGETLDYNLHWTTISGGSARMTISPLNGDRYRITSVGKSGRFFSRFFRVRDEIESVVDRTTFSTQQYHKILDERGRKKDELTVIRNGTATRKDKTIKVPDPVFDPLSLIYHLRTLDLTPGKMHEFTVIADGKLYTLHANVLQRETIDTPAGKFNTVLVEPKMESQSGIYRDEQRRLLIWYSDDDRHLPVRIRSDLNFGSITATLRGVQPGVSSTEPSTLRGQ